MIHLHKTLLAAMCSLALAGAAAAAEPDDPKAEPAESHHGGGDAMQHDRTAHGVEGPSPHDHDPGEHSHEDEGDRVHGPRCMPSTGDPDQDYALRLRHEYRRDLEDAKDLIAAGDDPTMRAIAQERIDANAAAMARLDTWLASQGVHPDRLPACMPRGHHAHGSGAHLPHDPPAFAALDVDRDGFVEHAELVDTHPWHRHFAMIDTNGDGMLTEAEIKVHNDAMARGDVTPRLTAAPHPAMPSGSAVIAGTDDNRDGVLTMAELAAGDMLHQHFAVADTNKDGRLTAVEIDAHHAQMHASSHH